MKKCSRCKQTLLESEFRKDRSQSDGLQHRCRPCHVEANREWVARNLETRRESQRRRELRKPGRIRKATDEQKRAVRVVANAVKAGTLIRPNHCGHCGTSDSPIQAHHHDYSLPLEVTWLCAKCHGYLHAHDELPELLLEAA